MSQFDAFDQLLSSTTSGDRWSDDGVLLAVEIIQLFEVDDWKTLRLAWLQRPEQWQGFAADVLSDAGSENAVPLLLDMIRLGSKEVKLVACDGLRVVLQDRSAQLEVGDDVKAIIEGLHGEESGLMAQSLLNLQTLLAHPGQSQSWSKPLSPPK